MPEKANHHKATKHKLADHKVVPIKKPALSIENNKPKTPHDDFVMPQNLNLRAKLLSVIVVLLAVLLVVVGLLAQSYNPKSTKAISSKGSKNFKQSIVNVEITAKGYNPSVITISRGQAVVWTNNDTVTHQVNSDPYPSDDQYASLNSLIPLGPKYNYSAVFDTPGTYHYHDDLNPTTFKGTVIVKN